MGSKKVSLKTRLLYGYISMLFILALTFMVSFYTDKMISVQRQSIDRVNLNLSNIALEIRKSNNYLDLFIEEQEINSIENYKESRDNIRILLDEITAELNENKDTQLYTRILNNLLVYESNLVGRILIRNEIDLKTYDMMVEYKTLASYMTQYSNLLINSYLEHGTKKHQLLMNDFQRIKTFMNSVFITVGVILFVYIGKIISNTTTILTRFSRAAKKISTGGFVVEDIQENRYEELNTLAVAFNQMKRDIQEYIEQMKEKASLESKLHEEKLKSEQIDKLYKESQFLALQNQINPHFLFNTLNTIKLTAMLGNSDETMNLVDSIGKILRYNLSNKSRVVTLLEELNVLKAYIYIQSTRFKEQISIGFQVDENIDLSKIYIPPMSIQPLVENSIKHGFKDIVSGGIINIQITTLENSIRILVKDNGKGMSEVSLRAVFDEDNLHADIGIGLRNIKDRLEIIFENSQLLEIQSNEKEGTTVIISLPKGRGGML